MGEKKEKPRNGLTLKILFLSEKQQLLLWEKDVEKWAFSAFFFTFINSGSTFTGTTAYSGWYNK